MRKVFADLFSPTKGGVWNREEWPYPDDDMVATGFNLRKGRFVERLSEEELAELIAPVEGELKSHLAEQEKMEAELAHAIEESDQKIRELKEKAEALRPVFVFELPVRTEEEIGRLFRRMAGQDE